MMDKRRSLDAKSFNRFIYGIGILIAVLILVFGAVFVIFLDGMSKEASKNKYISMNNNKKIEALSKMKDDYRGISVEKEVLEQYLPKDKDVSGLLKDLEKTATANSLTFSSYQVTDDKSKKINPNDTSSQDIQIKKIGDYNVLSFQVDLSGSFLMVGKTLKDIESFKRLLEVESVSYQKPNDPALAAGDNVTATLTINSYFKE